ncbi:PocR ligand-binding domain-containing protein [Halobacillus sp. Marseille-Q1614]|uniref:sensor histidine kinase n=1 Tax=Halobacillus sp. Marseille-Q1614 TaxID=2709134 RepID=UPI00156D63BC|nr:PocR ligand-binding domain-containing protein [Halobacillus sp. Marseille-Q1614]
MSVLTLRNIVDVEMLQEIQEDFSDATGFAVIIADNQGIPVTNPTNFTSFCTQIRSSPEGSQGCILSDKTVGLRAAERGEVVRHYCHSGLVDMAAPIVYNGKHLGSVLCGQVLIEGQDEKLLNDIRKKIKSLPIDQDLLNLFLARIEFTSEQQIESAKGMLQLVANYITKFGAVRIAQEEINEKSQILMKETKLRVRLEELLKETQLKVLQSQINPHFLYNTLNTISRLAYLENAEQTQSVTYSLSKIMRYSLRNIDQLVTLKEELDYTGNYLNIQQSRFRDRLQFKQVIDIDAEMVKLPILSIQPIIENAIIHGFEPRDDRVVIKIHGYLENESFVLEITDTGTGMSKEQLDHIFSQTSNPKNSHTTGIGMTNVHKRLQYYFGEEYGITAIESQIGVGTMVRMVIPVLGG